MSSKMESGVLCREIVSVARVCCESQVGTLEVMVCGGKCCMEEGLVSCGIIGSSKASSMKCGIGVGRWHQRFSVIWARFVVEVCSVSGLEDVVGDEESRMRNSM